MHLIASTFVYRAQRGLDLFVFRFRGEDKHPQGPPVSAFRSQTSVKTHEKKFSQKSSLVPNTSIKQERRVQNRFRPQLGVSDDAPLPGCTVGWGGGTESQRRRD